MKLIKGSVLLKGMNFSVEKNAMIESYVEKFIYYYGQLVLPGFTLKDVMAFLGKYDPDTGGQSTYNFVILRCLFLTILLAGCLDQCNSDSVGIDGATAGKAVISTCA